MKANNVSKGPWKDNSNTTIVGEVSVGNNFITSSKNNGLDVVGKIGASCPKNIDVITTDTHIFQDNIDSLTDTALKEMGFNSEFQSWKNMKYDRCGPKGGYTLHPDFKDFKSFLKHMGQKPDPTYTIDRINYENPEYSPDNCRWASKQLQSWNKSNTVMLTDPETGKSLPLVEWASILGTSQHTLRDRRKKGWSDEWVLYGKPNSAAHKNYHALMFWKQTVPGSPPQFLENLYQNDRQQLFCGSIRHENREQFLLQLICARCSFIENQIFRFHDPERPNEYQIPVVLKTKYERYDAIRINIIKYVYKNHSLNDAAYIICNSQRRGYEYADRFITSREAKSVKNHKANLKLSTLIGK